MAPFDRIPRSFVAEGETIEWHLSNDGGGCLCRLPADVCGAQLQAHAAATSTDAAAHLSVTRLLLYTRRRQCGTPFACPAVKRACSALLSADGRAATPWPEHLLDVLRSPDAYVRHTAVCAASETALYRPAACTAASSSQALLIDGLLRLATGWSTSAVATAAAVSVFARVLESSDDDPAVVDVPERRPSFCAGDSDRALVGARDTKALLLDRLHDAWTDVVDALVPRDGQTTAALIELVRLWKSAFSALSLGRPPRSDRFYSLLAPLQHLLYRTDTDPHLWLNTVRLLGAGLRGGSTACELARQIVEGVTSRRLLYFMGKQRKNSGDQHRVLQETALLTMRSLRVHAGRAVGDGQTVVAGTVTDVVDCLDSYVKSSGLYAPDVRFARWLVRLMCDRDDATVECLMCALDVADVTPATRASLEPLDGFAEFLACVSYEPDVLLDFLISDENEFLPYALRILKMACRDAVQFFRCCGDRLENAMESLIRLRLKILRLHENRVFPYNIGPIAKLIQRCDELYSEYIS